MKQWFHEFMTQNAEDPYYRIRVRFFRSEGLDRWQVFGIAAALPLLLQLSLLLFFIGLSELLREKNPIVGWATTVTMLVWLAVFVFTTFAPAVSPQCPYQTPMLKGPLGYLRHMMQLVYGGLRRYLIGGLYELLVGRIKHLWGVFCLQGDNLYRRFEHYVHLIESTPGWRKLPLLLVLLILCVPFCAFWAWATIITFVVWGAIVAVVVVPLLTFLGGLALVKIIYRHWPDTSRWEYTPLEEKLIKECDVNDMDIIAHSDRLFLNQYQQLREVLMECVKHRSPLDMVEHYDGTPSSHAWAENVSLPWRVAVDSATQRRRGEVVLDMAFEKWADDIDGMSWFQIFKFVLDLGEDGEYWEGVPASIVQVALSTSKRGYGAGIVFLALYSSLVKSSDNLKQFRDVFKKAQIRGNSQCMLKVEYLNSLTDRVSLLDLENIVIAAEEIFFAFWGSYALSTPATDINTVEDIISKENIQPDSVILCKSLDMLVSLVPSEIQAIKGESIARYSTDLWEHALDNRDFLPSHESCIETIYSSIERRVQLPLLILYSSSTRDLFNHRHMCSNSKPQRDSLQCMSCLLHKST